MTQTFMRTDERKDIISSITLFIDALNKVDEDASYWKRAVISLHSAIQSIMAFHLGFGNSLLVMSQKDAEAWLLAHHEQSTYPETQMDNFLNLYKKLKKHEIFGFKFVPHGQEGASIKKLNMLRNEFIHFMPKGWSIEISFMVNTFIHCINIIKRIGSGPISMRWEDDLQAQTFVKLVEIASEAVNAIKTTNQRINPTGR